MVGWALGRAPGFCRLRACNPPRRAKHTEDCTPRRHEGTEAARVPSRRGIIATKFCRESSFGGLRSRAARRRPPQPCRENICEVASSREVGLATEPTIKPLRRNSVAMTPRASQYPSCRLRVFVPSWFAVLGWPRALGPGAGESGAGVACRVDQWRVVRRNDDRICTRLGKTGTRLHSLKPQLLPYPLLSCTTKLPPDQPLHLDTVVPPFGGWHHRSAAESAGVTGHPPPSALYSVTVAVACCPCCCARESSALNRLRCASRRSR